MFDIGGGEFVGLVLLGLLLFGPERLPALARDAAVTIKKIRSFTSSATSELRENLGPEFAEISDLEPKNFIRKTLLDDGVTPPKTAQPTIDPDAT